MTDDTRAGSHFGRNMALTAALLGWMFDGFEMGLFPLIGGPALADLLGPCGRGRRHQVVWRDHRRVSGRRRHRRCVLRVARRPHRARPRDGAQYLHLRHLHRPLRVRDRGLAHRCAPLRRVARHGRRVVAGCRAGQRNLAQQVPRADCGVDRRRGKSRISDGGRAEHRPPQFYRRRGDAVAGNRDARRRGRYPACELRLALPDDQRRPARADGLLHPAVRARIEKVGRRTDERRDVVLVEQRSHRRHDRVSRIDRDHLELVAGRHRPRTSPPSSR